MPLLLQFSILWCFKLYSKSSYLDNLMDFEQVLVYISKILHITGLSYHCGGSCELRPSLLSFGKNVRFSGKDMLMSIRFECLASEKPTISPLAWIC